MCLDVADSEIRSTTTGWLVGVQVQLRGTATENPVEYTSVQDQKFYSPPNTVNVLDSMYKIHERVIQNVELKWS